MDGAEQQQEVATTMHRSIESAKRRGQWIRIDVFTKRFPGKAADQQKTKWRTKNGHKAQWVKVYRDEEGIEDFSEASEDEVAHTIVLDAGDEVLDEDQAREAALDAKKATLGTGVASQYTMVELGMFATSSRSGVAQPAVVVATPSKKMKRETSDPTDISDDEQAPMNKKLRVGFNEECSKKDEKAAAGNASPQEVLAWAESLLRRFQEDIIGDHIREAGKLIKKGEQKDKERHFDDVLSAKIKEVEAQVAKARKKT